MLIPLEDPPVDLVLTMTNIAIKADVLEDAAGQPLALNNGLLSGVLPKDILVSLAVDVFADSLPDGMTSPELVDALLQPMLDMDTNNDGTADAMSVGLQFSTTLVNVTCNLSD